MDQSRVSIIILNWNGWKDTIECLESLYQSSYWNYDVIVVDNYSNDGSISKIIKYARGEMGIQSKFINLDLSNKPINVLEIEEDGQIKVGAKDSAESSSRRNLIIIKNKKNYGFAEGNNIGMRFAGKVLKPDYLLLLNNDTTVEKRFLFELINVAENNPQSGVIGPKICFYDQADLIQSLGVKIHWHLGECRLIEYKKKDNHRFDSPIEVDSISGCCMLIKREILDINIFLDNKYFLYYEDTDFCVRVKDAGYKILVAPKSIIWHKNSISSKKIIGTREYYSTRNLFIFMKRFSSKSEFDFFVFYFFIFRLWLNIAIICVYHQDPRAVIPFIHGMFDGIKYSI